MFMCVLYVLSFVIFSRPMTSQTHNNSSRNSDIVISRNSDIVKVSSRNSDKVVVIAIAHIM